MTFGYDNDDNPAVKRGYHSIENVISPKEWDKGGRSESPQRLANKLEFPEIEGLEGVTTYPLIQGIILEALEGTDETQQALAMQGMLLTALLISKNKNYGNSALAPISVFSKATPQERMAVRMDDKINRLVNGLNDADEEDARRDFAGYLLLMLAGQQTGAL